jgi:transposase-like protein/IS1 family transposase
VFYPLLFAALVSLCLIIHVWWPDPLKGTPSPIKPDKPQRKRPKEPKPFVGYLQKPLCEACEHGVDSRPQAPGSLPPVIRFTRGRRRTIDTSGHFCPDPDCSYHGRLGLGNIRANGHPGGQPWRQFQCVSCQGYFYETHGTIFHGKRSSPDLIVHVIGCLAQGLGIRGTARVFEIDPNTVLGWLIEAAEQLRAFDSYFLHDLHLNQVQLDELYATLSAVRDGEMSEAEAIDHLSTSPRWVWTAIDPESKLMLSAQVGDRSLAMAQTVLHQIVEMLAPGCVPLFLSDGNPSYLPAIVRHFGHWVQLPRRQAKGPALKPRWMPLPGLLYAQVVKKTRRRRIVEIKRYVVIGTQAAVEQVLKAYGWVINTAFVERLNLSLRQRVAPIRRRSATSCKGEAGLDSQLSLFQV